MALRSKSTLHLNSDHYETHFFICITLNCKQFILSKCTCSGLIGRGWAMLFAGGGYNVYLYDVENSQLTNAKKYIEEQLVRLEETNLLRGQLSAKQQIELIHVSNDLGKSVKDAKHVQVQFHFNNLP